MSFGKNPYVPKAQAAEQKAADAADTGARTRAYRDAAHQWDRAAERETPGKRRSEYEEHATRNRELADSADGANGGTNGLSAGDEAAFEPPVTSAPANKGFLN